MSEYEIILSLKEKLDSIDLKDYTIKIKTNEGIEILFSKDEKKDSRQIGFITNGGNNEPTK